MFRRQPWMQRAGEFPRSDREYFALLVRAVFSAGLGPRVIESRWEGIRAALRDLDPAAVSEMDAADVDAFLADPGVIRNRRKAEAVVTNAGAFLEVVAEYGSFHTYLDRLKEEQDFLGMAEALSGRFTHLGRTSAGLFLFSAGWRGADFSALPEEADAANAVAQTTGAAAGEGQKPAAEAADAIVQASSRAGGEGGRKGPGSRGRPKAGRRAVAAAAVVEAPGADVPAAAG